MYHVNSEGTHFFHESPILSIDQSPAHFNRLKNFSYVFAKGGDGIDRESESDPLSEDCPASLAPWVVFQRSWWEPER
jgi:hypothetical protein